MDTRIRERLYDLAEEAPSGPGVPPAMLHRARRRMAITVSASACVVVILGMAAIAGIRSLPEDPEPAIPSPPPVGARTEAFFYDIGTREARPLPLSVRSIPGAGNFKASADGSLLLFDTSSDDGTSADDGAPSQIYVASIDGSDVRQLTDKPDDALAGSWSPDGTSIAYVSWGEARTARLRVVDVSTGDVNELVSGGLAVDFEEVAPPSWHPDGFVIVYTYRSAPSRYALWAVNMGGNAFFPAVFGAAWGSYSPDGSMIAFHELGAIDSKLGRTLAGVSIANADGSHPRSLTDPDPEGRHWEEMGAVWSPDGNNIAYYRRVGLLDIAFLVDVHTGQVTRLGRGFRPTGWLDNDTLIVQGRANESV